MKELKLQYRFILKCRIRKTSRDRSQILYLMTSSQLRRQEDKKASILIWISIFFIACQSVKLVPDLYEAFYCAHKEVRLNWHYRSINQFYGLHICGLNDIFMHATLNHSCMWKLDNYLLELKKIIFTSNQNDFNLINWINFTLLISHEFNLF